MAERLCSVGIDVGTTTTQLIVSELTAQNTASAFAVPRMEITGRQVVYTGDVHFTPLLSGDLVDGEGIRGLLAAEYEKAGLCPEDVDTGAVIITGETSRKENAATVLASLADLAGEMVVATAGPDLESVLAAKGAGALERQGRVLHMDIGGGTSNLALIQDGHILQTACFNVGGRLVKLSPEGRVTYLSPVLQGQVAFAVGDILHREQAMDLARRLAAVLEASAGLTEPHALYEKLITQGTHPIRTPGEVTLSFSGGVAECIREEKPWLAYGDLGPLLGQAIRESRLCRGQYYLDTIRATVIGAGSHSTQLSGSTVYLQNVALPLKNLPVACLTEQEQELPGQDLAALVDRRLAAQETAGAVYLPGWNAPSYNRVTELAQALAQGFGGRPCCVLVRQDMAKVLGNALSLRLPKTAACLCLDQVDVPAQSYLDVLGEVGSAISLIVKTLILTGHP